MNGLKTAICIGGTVIVVALTSGYILTSPQQVVRYEIHTVVPGDTIWDIAEQYNQDQKRDTRDIVADIIADNNLNTTNIQVGEQLKVRVIETKK